MMGHPPAATGGALRMSCWPVWNSPSPTCVLLPIGKLAAPVVAYLQQRHLFAGLYVEHGLRTMVVAPSMADGSN